MHMVQVDGTDILLVHLDGRIRAMQGICSHEYFELDKGFLTRDSLTCALHLSRFDLDTGEALDPPAELPLVMLARVHRGRGHGRGRAARRPDRHQRVAPRQPGRTVPSPAASAARRTASPNTRSATPVPRWTATTWPGGSWRTQERRPWSRRDPDSPRRAPRSRSAVNWPVSSTTNSVRIARDDRGQAHVVVHRDHEADVPERLWRQALACRPERDHGDRHVGAIERTGRGVAGRDARERPLAACGLGDRRRALGVAVVDAQVGVGHTVRRTSTCASAWTPAPTRATLGARSRGPHVATATPLTAAVRVAVMGPASMTARGRPVRGSHSRRVAWSAGSPRPALPGNPDTNLTPSRSRPSHRRRHPAPRPAWHVPTTRRSGVDTDLGGQLGVARERTSARSASASRSGTGGMAARTAGPSRYSRGDVGPCAASLAPARDARCPSATA